MKRKNFIYLFIVVVMAFTTKDYIINSLINIDEDHKDIVRVLAEQNMLSQRITKLALLIQNDLDKDTVANSRPDSMAQLIPRWKANHQWLKVNNIKHGEEDRIAELVTEYLEQATPYVEIISTAGLVVLDQRGKNRQLLDNAVSKIDRYELPYHALVERSINLYKAQMEEEHLLLTKLQYILSIVAIAILVTGFIMLILPIFNKLTREIGLRKEVEANLTKAVQSYLVSETVLSQHKKELEEVHEAISRSALVTITDTAGNILKVNQMFSDLTGFTQEELVGRNHRLISSNHHPKEFWTEFWMTIKSGKSWKGEVKNLRKDGKEIWMDTVINPIMGEGGVIRQFLAIRFDITARKQAEELAVRRDNELRAISNTFLPVGIISTDTTGNIVLFSKGAEALLGYEAYEMIRKNPMAFHVESEVMERNAELTKEFNQQFTPFETFVTIPEKSGYESRQWTYIKKDGTRFPVQLVISPIRNEKNEITGYVGIAVDISDRFAAERAMQYAMEQAEEASRSKSQFLANMSHEIRTPLNSILGFSELLSETVHEPKQRTQLNTIISSGRTLLALINDLLNIAKIEAGKLELEYRETNLSAIASEVSQMFIHETKSRGVNLSVETQQGFPERVLTDDMRVKQILVNLLGNAVKFTHNGFIRIYLESKPTASKPGHSDVIIRVQDSGIGIEKKHHKQIFEAFHQVLDTTTSQYGGTGLGLSISQKLVELMGGSISVESELHKGSTFTVSLPALRNAKAIIPDEAISAHPNEFSFCANKTILIVDDVESNINLILDFLEGHPFRKLVARGGAEAVVIAQQDHPDLILMDLKMPGMDGWEATRQIRKIESMKKTPIIACTANVVGVSMKDNLFNGIIIKPFRKVLLIDELKKYLQLSEVPSTTDVPESTNILSIRQGIGSGMRAQLRNQFAERLESAAGSFEVSELERLLNELEQFMTRNQIGSLEEIVMKAKNHFRNFELDALSSSLKRIGEVIEE